MGFLRKFVIIVNRLIVRQFVIFLGKDIREIIVEKRHWLLCFGERDSEFILNREVFIIFRLWKFSEPRPHHIIRNRFVDGFVPNHTRPAVKMEPAEGFEPPTSGLQNRCATTTLYRLWVGA